MMKVITGRQSAGDEKHWSTGIVPMAMGLCGTL